VASGFLQRGNSLRKNQGFGGIGMSAAQLTGGIASRTASRGGCNQLGDRTASCEGPKLAADDNQYKKLVVNQEILQKPVPEQSEKEKSQADYQNMMQNFAANNYIAPAVGNAKDAVRQKSKFFLFLS
jgi:hypothetical protein